MDLLQAKAVFLEKTAGFEGFWCVAGGWAIDFYLNELTRPHEDLEIVVLREEHELLYEHFRSQHAQKVISGEPPEFVPWEGGPLEEDIIQLRLAPLPGAQGPVEFDLLLTPSENGEWICRRDEGIRRPLQDIVQLSVSGVPCLAPEIVLLFKAKYVREKDAADFDRVVSRLSENARAWLRHALETVHPGHLWLKRL
jgi:hypothetical protein